MRRLAIGVLVLLPFGGCTYTVKKYNWIYPAGDSLGEIRLKRTYSPEGVDQGCKGAFVSGTIKVKRGKTLVWEVRNGCSASDGYTVELKNFTPVACGQSQKGARSAAAAAGPGLAIASLFTGCPDIQKGLKGYVPANGTGFLGCTIKDDAPRGCYSYSIWVNGIEVADPEVEIQN